MSATVDDTSDIWLCTADSMTVECDDPDTCPLPGLPHTIGSECAWCPHEAGSIDCPTGDDDCPHWHRAPDITVEVPA